MKSIEVIRKRVLSMAGGFAVLFFMAFTLASCDVATNSQKGTLKVVMFDAPGEYEEVWVHISRVEVNNTANEDTGWVVVNEPDESYNLLELVNGANVVLGEAELEEGTYRQIRLILGDDNYIVVDGETSPLMVPSGQQTGIKLNVDAEIIAGITYTLMLDFDVQQSVVRQGATGSYALQPVIRAINEATTGNITGQLDPVVEGAVISAFNGEGEYAGGTHTDANGSFLLIGLGDGFYTITVEAGDEFDTETLNDVEVRVGQVTDLGTIELTASE
jgi:hypothetical protein